MVCYRDRFFYSQHSNSHRELSAFRYIATGGPVVYHLEIQRHSSVSVYAAHRVIHYDALESMRLLHQSDKLILRHSGGKKYVIYLDFWNDGNGIYDRLAAELVRRHGSALGARLAADGRLKFGKVTALADRLEHKNRAVPYAQIASIRTQREEGAGSSMSYLMISTATGRICKIDRSTIVNEPLLLNFLSQRLPA